MGERSKSDDSKSATGWAQECERLMAEKERAENEFEAARNRLFEVKANLGEAQRQLMLAVGIDPDDR